MEIQFHQQQKGKMSKLKGKNNKNKSNNKFVGVRQRPSGRWVAEIKDTTQKIRMWLGTFETAEDAARAYDEAACLLRGSKTRTNFVTHVSANSPLASRIKHLLNSKKKTEEKQSHKQSIEVSNAAAAAAAAAAASTSSASSSPTGSGGDFSCVGKVNDHTQLFDDGYKPDLSICNDDCDLGFCHRSNMSWSLGFAQEMLEVPNNMNVMPEISSGQMEFSEFERMKVERQISASLYALNGVQEYMDTVYDPNEVIWDLPTLCSLFS